jgi:hypothetical protein
MSLAAGPVIVCAGDLVEIVARRRRGVCMIALIEGSTGTDDSGACTYEKDALGSSPRDCAGESGASGSVGSAKISLAARRCLGRREERLALNELLWLLLF